MYKNSYPVMTQVEHAMFFKVYLYNTKDSTCHIHHTSSCQHSSHAEHLQRMALFSPVSQY